MSTRLNIVVPVKAPPSYEEAAVVATQFQSGPRREGPSSMRSLSSTWRAQVAGSWPAATSVTTTRSTPRSSP